jgi:chromosome segregation ATPase
VPVLITVCALQESLGGNAATVMIAAISPADYNYEETVGTLKYANRAKSIENVVTRNEDVNERMIRELKEQIEKLKAELQHGGAGGSADPEIVNKLRQMEEEQRNAWEEKERLSQALAAERQANMSSVISHMMSEIKEQKIDHMKKIKLLSLEKSDLMKSQKAAKEKADSMKATLDKKMTKYNALKVEYEANRPKDDDPEDVIATKKLKKSELAQEMQALLQDIETVKTKWVEKKDALKVLREKVSTTEEAIDSAKADLVVAHGLLDQNDKLRQKIYEEERAKVKDQLAKEISAAKAQLDEEREAVREGIVAEVADKVARINKELQDCQEKLSVAEEDVYILSSEKSELQEYADKLEGRLVDAEANYEAAEVTIAGLRDEIQSKDDFANRIVELESEKVAMREQFDKELDDMRAETERRVQAVVAASGQSVEEQKYALFKSMMDTFDEERRGMEAKYRDLQKLLSQATKVRLLRRCDIYGYIYDVLIMKPCIAV